MPKVSVIIPAYKEQFLDAAIQSVLCQTFQDYELIVSDDTGHSALAAIAGKYNDKRIRYVSTSGLGAVANCRSVYERASGEYVKFLFDDDILFPLCLTRLVGMLDNQPEAGLAFNHRYVIDEHGAIISAPEFIGKDKQVLIGTEDIRKVVLGNIRNRIGELSNTLIRRTCVSPNEISTYAGQDILVINDVTIYMSATASRPCVGVGEYHSAFRKHANQNSLPSYNPYFSAGIYEWELILRKELDIGNISRSLFDTSLSILVGYYEKWVAQFPELEAFRSNAITSIRAEPDMASPSNPEFLHCITTARSTMLQRKNARI